ncbi:MAG: metalloregulator ArsR/SmtB family transcription factor [Candidatus Bilamarchaeaceae archaeon]
MNTDIINAVSSETRLKMLAEIGKREICACRLPAIVKKTQPAVSQHLGVLREADLVKSRKDGAKVLYSLTEKGKRVLSDIKRW